MDDLVALADIMKQATTLLGDAGEESATSSSFLQVVVVGSAGAGKSAVLNSLIGHPVLPTADGGATRYPLLADLERDANIRPGNVLGTIDDKMQLSTSAEIRRAVQSGMKRWLPTQSRGREDARLTIRSASAPPLRVVDLPGVEQRGSDMDNVVRDYTSNGDAVLLVVLPASSAREAARLHVVQLAREIDPEGKRTVGVITKVDQSAKDGDALKSTVDLLLRRGTPLTQGFPWVAVIGLPQGGASGNELTSESLEDGWKLEMTVLPKVLATEGGKNLDSVLGRNGLVKVLGKQLRLRMKDRIPALMVGLEGKVQEVETELFKMGDALSVSLEGTRALALELCRNFEDKFMDIILTGEKGGARIVERFETALPGRFKGLPLNNLFKLDSVKQVCLEADGYQPYLLSPEKGLRLLIKRALDMAKQPGLQCVEEVHRVLLDVVAAAGNQVISLTRYPPLKREIVAIASTALEDYRNRAKDMVAALVDMEKAFVPPGYFIKLSQRRSEKLSKEEALFRKREDEKARSAKSAVDAEQALVNKEDGNKKSLIPMNLLKGQKSPNPPTDKEATKESVPAAPLKELAGFLWKKSDKNDWSKRWFALSDKTARLYYVKKPAETQPRGIVSLEECIVEEVVAPDELPPTGDVKDAGKLLASQLSFKISNKTPYKVVVKGQYALILRADNAAEKTEWVTRIRACTRGSKVPTPTGSRAESPDTSAASSARPSTTQPALSGATFKRVDSAESFTTLRKQNLDPDEDLKVMTEEVREYVDSVLHNLANNIPKAIVLCQVEKVKETMLNKLYSSISGRPNEKIEELMQEDPVAKGRRERVKAQSSALAKLRKSLSFHEARASAQVLAGSGDGSGSGRMAETEDWRTAFSEAGNDGDGREGSPVSILRAPGTPPQPVNGQYTTANGSVSDDDLAAASGRRPGRLPPPPPPAPSSGSGGSERERGGGMFSFARRSSS
eukprot:SM000303S11781  [mRNA]  locus=s303:99059:105867:+ [translate_table: standard]